MFESTIKNSFLLLTGVFVLTTATRAYAQSNLGKSPMSEFSCAAREMTDRFPTSIRFQVTSLDQLEASAAYKDGRSVPPASLKRIEIPMQPKTAVFQVAGAIGVSGEAKVLISKDALRFGEVGTIMLINQSTRDSVDYQCQKVPTGP